MRIAWIAAPVAGVAALVGAMAWSAPEDRSRGDIYRQLELFAETASALAAEALKSTLPASVFSRSTECHNQDKVSMGTIAARDALRVVELTEQVVAISMLAVAQAVDLRLRVGGHCRPRSLALRDAVRRRAPFVDADRRQDGDIAAILSMLRTDDVLALST